MVNKAIPDTPKYNLEQVLNTIVLDADNLANVQRGLFKQAEFFGNIAETVSHQNFLKGINASRGYSGYADYHKSNSGNNEGNNFKLSTYELNEIKKKATSISRYSNMTFNTIYDFLLILVSVDKIEDMRKIANAIQLPELDNENILRKPLEIINITGLEKIAFMASAVESLTKIYSKYTDFKQTKNNNSDDSISSVISNIGDILGGIGNNSIISEILENVDPSKAVGSLMSELVTGKRIPMSVISKNPNVVSPSYIGKVFFGENPMSLPNIDIDQVFLKKLGVFPDFQNGSGVMSFNFQNLGSFSQDLNAKNLINKVLIGGKLPDLNSFKDKFLNEAFDKVKSITGVTLDESFNVRQADVGIPLMNALSAVSSNMDKSPFPIETFQKGWQLANSVGNHMQNINSDFMDLVRLYG